MTLRRVRWDRIGYIALLVLVVLVVAACAAPGTLPAASGVAGSPAPTPTPAPPLQPASPDADPISLLAWAFTPVFKAMFIILVAVYDLLTAIGVPAAIGWAIVVLTLVVRIVVIPLYRRQLDIAAPDAAPPARDQGDPAAVQGRLGQGEGRAAGADEGARHQPAGRLPPAPAPDAPAVHDVLGHPRRADQRRPDGDAARSSGSRSSRSPATT